MLYSAELKVRVEDKRSGNKNEPFEYVSRGGLSDLVDSLVKAHSFERH